MRQSGLLAAAGLHALRHNRERLVRDHEHARRLACAFDLVEGLRPVPPETNILLVDVVDPAFDVGALLSFLQAHRILMLEFGTSRLRAVTHRDVTSAGIAHTITALAEFAASGSKPADVA